MSNHDGNQCFMITIYICIYIYIFNIYIIYKYIYMYIYIYIYPAYVSKHKSDREEIEKNANDQRS